MIREKTFSTAFVHPDRFRFEYNERRRGNIEYRYIVCRKELDVQTWWDVTPGIKTQPTLAFALGAATGVSSGSAHTIPALLMPDEIGGRRLTDITEPKLIEDAMLEKMSCFRIQGQWGSALRTLWVDKKTFLVRKIVSQREGKSISTQTTTTYTPVINGEVTEQMLEFDPPKQN